MRNSKLMRRLNIYSPSAFITISKPFIPINNENIQTPIC